MLLDTYLQSYSTFANIINVCSNLGYYFICFGGLSYHGLGVILELAVTLMFM